MSIIDAMRAWLPYPKYQFRGGPFDGEYRTVDLYETHRGMEPPRIWRIADLPPATFQPYLPDVTPDRIGYTVHDYEFVPVQSFNQGYYLYIEPKGVSNAISNPAG